MLEMASLAAEGGGLNFLMAGTFWVFVVIGPLSRSLTQVRVAVTVTVRVRVTVTVRVRVRVRVRGRV